MSDSKQPRSTSFTERLERERAEQGGWEEVKFDAPGSWEEVKFDAPGSWEEFARFAREGNPWWVLGRGYAALIRQVSKHSMMTPDGKLRLARYIERRCERECGELLPLDGTVFRYGDDDQVHYRS